MQYGRHGLMTLYALIVFDAPELGMIMAALCNREAIIFLRCDFYLSIDLSFPRLISAAAGWMSTIL